MDNSYHWSEDSKEKLLLARIGELILGGNLPGSLVLIETESGKALDVLDDLKDIDSIKKVEVITGDYDIMAMLESDSQDEIRRVLIEEIRNIEGVKGTKTHDFISLRRVRREHL